jgi:beta-lactamase regulating signal transducer with metallopeptidase domain
MILSWMLYASVIALLLALAAASLETVVCQQGRPTRWLWTGSMAGSLFLPVITASLAPPPSSPASTAPSATNAAAQEGVGVSSVEWLMSAQPLAAVMPSSFNPDPWLVGFWAAGSTLLLTVLLVSYASLRLRRRQWRVERVDGHVVWVSPDTGPAVVGILHQRIVLPEWVLQEEAEARGLILAHELEHLRARDPQLLLGSLLFAVATVWNLPVWWQWRRLRQAVEVDCDLRVLAQGVNPRTYGRLLVDVSERGAAHRLAVAALSESPSFLGRRIRLMCTSRPKHWRLRAVGSTALASILVFAACRVERPERSPVPVTGTTYTLGEDGALQPDAPASPARPADFTVDREEPHGARALREAVTRFFPEVVEEEIAASSVNLYFVADARGEMIRTAIDDGEQVGPIDVPLQKNLGLGTEIPRADVEGIGAQRFSAGELGPNNLNIYFVALQPRPGEEDAEPTDIFLFFEGRRPPPDALLRSAVEQHHPQALLAEGEAGERLWFLVNERNQVLRTGRGITPSSSAEAEALLQAQFPNIRIGRLWMSSAVQTDQGRRIPLVWAQLERGSPLP